MTCKTSKPARALSCICKSLPNLRRLTHADLPLDTLALAERLIGAVLVRERDGRQLVGRIVETEAYQVGDPSSHAFRGQTKRNRSMFLRHAHAYVYRIYGTAFCLNIASETAGEGAAVLIRAVVPLLGVDAMLAARARPDVPAWAVARGPGNLTRAFAIGPELDGIDLDVDERLWLATDGTTLPSRTSVRIGLSKAVERLHRWYVPGVREVSGPRRVSP